MPHVTKHDLEKSIEGEWIGLYSYLGWADFEALRDGNPAVLEANRTGHLRDYLGGPQRLTLQLEKPEDDEQCSPLTAGKSNNGIPITGRGVNGGPFTLSGRLRRVYLPSVLAGKDMAVQWRVTFTKTYANGENSWTRWIYDGIYCPGINILTVLMKGVGIIGRWRDGTEPEATGVTGPFWLWPKDATSSSPPKSQATSEMSEWDDAVSWDTYNSNSSPEITAEISL
jgi:hypothetical protein